MTHYTRMVVAVFPTFPKAQAALDDVLICAVQPRRAECYWRPVGAACADAMCDRNRIRRRTGVWGRLFESFMERDEQARMKDEVIVALDLREEDAQVALRVLRDHDPVVCHLDGRYVAVDDDDVDFDVIFRAEMVDYLPPQVTMY